ncbi:lysophospholipid acyltransferase family protein [Actibacterium lipolyticum]|uniref:1-acyl-sn-glycerol-3-phosphate acyltransferase n=1 Tax=Actibacterium lipolyticum TaxID=1524263 RepID=A0A238KTL3_9RHOB|nr:lysophospholipid acyltransferase family protein [Actibacterium lipolyticum]SMX45941.1 1-acyl-sn-glycerol-3-phosphate acyltransferase [Actibacterium lipolyticum]
MPDTSNPSGQALDAPTPAIIRIPKRIALVLLGPFYFLFIAFIPVLCQSRRGFRGWYWKTVRRACSRLLWLLSIRVEISPEAREALRSDENSIIVINHRSHLDGFALMDILPDEKWITFGAKKELCDAALLRRGFSSAGLVEIDRKSGKLALDTLRDAVKTMPTRRSLVLFPEGTRAKTKTLGEFKAGAVLVARETDRLIRPIVILNSDGLLPRGKFSPLSGSIKIEVLAPFACDLDSSADDDVARLRATMSDVFEGNAKGL